MNKISSVEKRKLSIRKKALEKELKREQYRLKMGQDRINEIKQKIQETKQSNKTGLPKYFDDGKPKQVDKTTRLEKYKETLNIPNQIVNEEQKQRVKERKALNGTFREITLEDPNFTLAPPGVNEELVIKSISNTIFKQLLNKPDNINLLFNLVFKYTLYEIDPDFIDEETGIGEDIIIRYEFYYNSKTASILHSRNQILEWVKSEVGEFLADIINKKQSNLRFLELNYIKIQISRRTKTRASGYIDLPPALKTKRAVINIKNTDDECIVWSLLAYKHYDNLKTKDGNEVKDKNEVRHYKPYYNEIIQPKNITYPIDIQKDIKRFEKLNNLKINVFSYEDNDKQFKNLIPLYNTNKRNDNVVNLLLYKEHLMYIKDLGKLLRRYDNQVKMYHCSQCLSIAYDTQDKLNEHLNICMKHEAVKAKLPKKFEEGDKSRKDIITFRNIANTFNHPFFMTLDFESTLEKLDEINSDGNTQVYQKHKVNSVGIKFNCIHEQYSKPLFIINNQDPELLLKETIEYLEEQTNYAYKLTKLHENKIIMTENDEIEYKKSKSCFYCNAKYDKDNIKVRHHNHITGEFINPCCNNCNLQFKIKKFVPVYIHNLKGYDSHFLVPALNNYGYRNDEEDLISAIPNTEEKYISFSKEIQVDEYEKKNEIKPVKFEIRFLDSLAFMASSLSNLAENLNPFKGKEREHINELRQIFKYVASHKFIKNTK